MVSLINLASLRDLRSEGRRAAGIAAASAPMSGSAARRPGASGTGSGGRSSSAARCCAWSRAITRCPATEVNPETGERDADPVAELRSLYGHVELGVHAEVVDGGRFAIGDAMELMEPYGINGP